MKKWFKFFFGSFFSHKQSKEAAKHGYTGVFLGLVLAFVFVWTAFVGSDLLTFSTHFNSSPDFKATVHSLLSNPDMNKRIVVEISEGSLKLKKYGGEYTEALLINTFDSEEDKQTYSANGYNVVVDSRPADALAEIEAYAIANDGTNERISYEDYLTLSDVARRNFDFKLRYTGNELVLDDAAVEGYRAYIEGIDDKKKAESENLYGELEAQKITKYEYNRSIYQLYFTNYYPDITEYEESSKIPLLRNYYYHQYLKGGESNYLFIFDDYLAASFKTTLGNTVSFYGFFSGMADGILIPDGAEQARADMLADDFINKSYLAFAPISMYSYAVNVVVLIPFIALMPMVVTLLAYSILKLRGIDSIPFIASAFKIVGSYVWFSGAVAAVVTVIIAFFLRSGIITALPLIVLFITLAVRAIIFAITESKIYLKIQQTQQTEA